MTDKDTRQDPTEPVGPDTTGLPNEATGEEAIGEVAAGDRADHDVATPSSRDAATSTPLGDGPTVAVPVVPEQDNGPEHGNGTRHEAEPEAAAAPEPVVDPVPAAATTSSMAAPTQEDGGSRRANEAESTEVRNLDRAAAIAAAKRPAPSSIGPKSELAPDAQRRNAAREAALSAKPVLARVLQVVLAVAFPFLLVIGAIKAVASPWFLWFEYNRPGFPADQFGFTAAERLTYGSYGVDYLNNAAGAEFLGGLVDGSGNKLFLASEVSHMADVKGVVAASFLAGLILLVAAVLIGWYLGRKYAGGIRRGLFAGSVATVVAMAAVGVMATINWQAFFSGFHQVFFDDGTWTFSLSDTLIRLFPPQFWIDSGIAVAGLVLVVAIATLVATWPTARRRERSRLLQEARDFGLT